MNNLEGNVLCRKTDPEMTKICLSNTTDIYLTGADKVLKRYKFPEEKLEKIDLKVKLPALSPLEEVEGHFLPVTAIQFEKDFIVSGCQDGEVMIRHAGKMNEKQKMKVMNFKYNGVKSLYYSSRSQLIFVGGDDGSLMVL
jgi:WD40 repeat protein